jgi:hypothetical protein
MVMSRRLRNPIKPNGWHNLQIRFRLAGIGAGFASFAFSFVFRTRHAKAVTKGLSG